MHQELTLTETDRDSIAKALVFTWMLENCGSMFVPEHSGLRSVDGVLGSP